MSLLYGRVKGMFGWDEDSFILKIKYVRIDGSGTIGDFFDVVIKLR